MKEEGGGKKKEKKMYGCLCEIFSYFPKASSVYLFFIEIRVHFHISSPLLETKAVDTIADCCDRNYGISTLLFFFFFFPLQKNA